MTSNCSPRTFKAGLKAIFSEFELKRVGMFFVMVAIMMAAIFLFLSFCHALITLIGLARIHLFSLPIDTSAASFWISSSASFNDHVFWAGYDVFRWVVVAGFFGALLYFGCSMICDKGQLKTDSSDAPTPDVAD